MTTKTVRHYQITRKLARGGMGVVYEAFDTLHNRVVALKQVETTAERDAEFILQAERRGSELQRDFGEVSDYVPKIFETFDEDGDFFIAMELLGGEDLSSVIRRSPLPSERAAAIAVHLCQFLEAAHSFTAAIDGRPGYLLHGDLTPRNIRLLDDNGVKVLDFGIAKAVSATRRVTTNDFGNHAYLPPERLEHGTMNAEGDLWALGVVLYEMLRGSRPFIGDTHAIERRILSRRPPEPLQHCPTALAAIVARMLEGDQERRYPSARDIRDDLERFLHGDEPLAERDGWPELAYAFADEPPTRRTTRADEDIDEDVLTRRTADEFRPTAPTSARPAPTTSPLAPPMAAVPYAVPGPRVRSRRAGVASAALIALLLFGVSAMANEAWVWFRARPMTVSATTQQFAGINELWRQQRAMSLRSLGPATSTLTATLVSRTIQLSDDLFAAYHRSSPPVRDGRWKDAATALENAVRVAPNNATLVADLRYAQGQIHRIQGEADRKARLTTAQAHFSDTIAAFNAAAAKRPNWPDPYRGLLRTYVYGLDDIEAALGALNQAIAGGFVPGSRESAQLADGYKRTADRLRLSAKAAANVDSERDALTRAAEYYRQAIRRYDDIGDFGSAQENLQSAEDWLRRVERRLAEIG